MKSLIYLDHAAATPLDKQVFEAMRPYLSDKFYNPSATYLAAKAVHSELETARKTVAVTLGARPPEIVFTAGGTEANNLALFGVARSHPRSHIVSTAIEHESILKPLLALEDEGVQHTLVSPQSDGVVEPAKIVAAITDKTVLVSVMYANNEIGVIEPIRQIAGQLEIIRRKRQAMGNKLPLYLHTDACQAANYLDIHVDRLGVDLMTLNGGKIYGPKQAGVLYIKTGVELEPLIFGGGQERGLRSGTENIAQSIGFTTALKLAQQARNQETRRLHQLQKLFFDELAARLPKAEINGSLKHRLPNNVHVTIPGQDNERLMMALDEKGIICGVGSACSASDEEPSHVLRAIGCSDTASRSSLRFTMGRDTDEQAIHTTVTTLANLVA